MRLTVVVGIVVLLALSVSFCVASDINLQGQKLRVSAIGGTIGAGTAAYWPLLSLADYDVNLGPMLALGTEAVAFGGGVNIGVRLDFPVLEEVNFGWGGYGYDWTVGEWGWQFGVGKAWEVK